MDERIFEVQENTEELDGKETSEQLEAQQDQIFDDAIMQLEEIVNDMTDEMIEQMQANDALSSLGTTSV